VELLKQPQYSPMPVERQVVSIWAGINGYLDEVPAGDVRRFENELLDFVERQHPGVYDALRETGKLDDELAARLKEAVEEFAGRFRPSSGERAESDQDGQRAQEQESEPLEEDEEQERIRRYRLKQDEDQGEQSAGPAGRGGENLP
jgi:F-type H+-transporting ATPase subunit alpha